MAKAVKAAIVIGLVATGVGALTGAIASGSAFSLFGTTLAKGSLSAYFATQFTTSLVLGAVSQAMSKNSSGAISSGATITGRNALSPHQVIYGRTRVGGNIVYMEGTDGNRYLHVVVAIAGHEIDAIEKYYLNDEEVSIDGSGNVTAGSYANRVRIKSKLGTDDQTAFSDLVSESDSLWTSDHRLRGRAVVYIRLEYDQDKFPSGMPNFSFQVRGKRVYDPRSNTTVWSANPALCIADYLTNTRYGLGCVYANEIDEAALIAAANVCDEDVTLEAGGTENKYELHGSILTSGTPEDIINQMLTSMAGKAIWTSGKWRILAGAYYTPTLTFDEDDLRSGFTVQSLVSRRENFNCVKGVFVSAEDKYMSVDFPPLISDAFIALDNGEAVYKNITLPFTTSVTMAQRLSKIELLKARQQITLTLPLKLQGLKANVGDLVYVNNSRLGWSSKPFEVVAMSMSVDEAPAVDLDLREISTAVFDWTTNEEQAYDPAPNTSLPNPFQVSPVTNLTITATNVLSPDGATQSGLLVTWTPPVNSFVTQYEVQYIRGASNFDYGTITASPTETLNYGAITGTADTFADYGAVSDPTTSGETNYNSIFVSTPYYVVVPAIAGVEYAVRVRGVNTLGVRSSFVTSNEITYGDQTAPNVPSSIVASADYKQIVVTWVNPTVADFDYVEVYRNTTNNSGTATLAGILRGSRFVDAPLDINVTRYYWLKSVDRTGNKSGFSSVVSATTLFIDSDSFSQEVLNLFSEAGAYGIEPVASLPATGDFDGQIKYNTTQNKLYRWDASTSTWTDDIFSIAAGTVDVASFAAGIEPIKIVNELPVVSGYAGPKLVFLTTDNTIYRYTGTAWTSGIDADDINGTLPSSAFSQSLRPVEIVGALPSSANFQGRTVMLTTDNKLYRYTGTAWTAAVPSTDISGQVSDAQIAGLSAGKVTGQLTNSQIADIATAKLTGTISGSQIADAAISAVKIASAAVTTAKIATDAITADVIAAGAITAPKIGDAAITAGKIAANAVETAKLAVGAVTEAVLAAGAISADKIQTNAITETKIASGAITTPKISAGAITSDTIAANAIVSAKIEAGAITTAKISAGAITASEISSGAITTVKIAAGAVTATEIGASAITAGKISAGAVETAKIAAGAITTETLAAGAITTAKIAAGAITATEISSNSITSAKIATDAITAEKIAAGAVTASEISANAVTAEKIEAAAVTTAKLAAGAVTADTIAANAVTTAKISAGAIEADKLAVNSVQATNIAAGAVTAGKIAANAVTATEIASDSITSAKIVAGAITATKVQAGAIGADQIAANAITTGKIAAGAVSADQIAANAIVAGKIAADAITTDKILAGAIQTDKIAANSITGGLIAAAGVITSAAQINDAIITNAKIVNGAITTAKIGDAQITTAKINDAAITSAKIENAAITSAKIGDAQITTAKIGTAQVQTLTIAGNAVTVPVSSFSAGESRNTAIDTFQDVQTVTITTSGQRVYIASSANYLVGIGDGGESGNVSLNGVFRLVRDSTELMQSTETSMSYSETPASGTYTYKLQCKTLNPSFYTVISYAGASNRSLFVIETKR
jgi:hypothetical protein